MKVKILIDTTLTVKAGQTVEIDGSELPFLSGRVELIGAEPAHEAAPEKAKKKNAKKSGK